MQGEFERCRPDLELMEEVRQTLLLESNLLRTSTRSENLLILELSCVASCARRSDALQQHLQKKFQGE